MTGQRASLAGRVVDWQTSHGRHHLPWQNTRDPYRVWLSEIMLQQTQVSTALAYFERFVERFPDVMSLAAASEDEVLGLWSGLGYYSRARNLHRCAQQVAQQHGGRFPPTAEQLQTLPGIGRSTAAAIAAFCYGERVAILDGNVKRVLTRALGFGGDLAIAANERALWDLATDLLPTHDLPNTMPRYTQGLMDLGATVCLSRQPNCLICPLQAQCVAAAQGRPTDYPVKNRKLKRSAQSLWLLWVRTADDAVWLARRPTPGVWGGLYCLPLFDSHEALLQAVPAAFRSQLSELPMRLHVLTHKDLYLHPVSLVLPDTVQTTPLNFGSGQWHAPAQWHPLGLPAPIRKLLSEDL